MAKPPLVPARADVWLAHFGHQVIRDDGELAVSDDGEPVFTRYHEYGGKRPCLVISIDDFNRGLAELAIVLPMTTRYKPLDSRIQVDPPEGGLRVRSFVICEGIRSIARHVLIQRWGRVEDRTMHTTLMRLGELFSSL